MKQYDQIVKYIDDTFLIFEQLSDMHRHYQQANLLEFMFFFLFKVKRYYEIKAAF